MTAIEALAAARASGVHIRLDGGDLVLEADDGIPADVIDALRRHKAEALAILRPHPSPRIRKEPPFGSDKVPERFEAAWQALLAHCPPGGKPFVWEAAIHDCAVLFGDFGRLLDEYRWAPDDLFAVPHGLRLRSR